MLRSSPQTSQQLIAFNEHLTDVKCLLLILEWERLMAKMFSVSRSCDLIWFWRWSHQKNLLSFTADWKWSKTFLVVYHFVSEKGLCFRQWKRRSAEGKREKGRKWKALDEEEVTREWDEEERRKAGTEKDKSKGRPLRWKGRSEKCLEMMVEPSSRRRFLCPFCSSVLLSHFLPFFHHLKRYSSVSLYHSQQQRRGMMLQTYFC